MKVGDLAYYITGGKLHVGTVLFQRDGIINIREKRKITRKRASEVAWEVSGECRRIGLENVGTGGKKKDSISTNGNSGYIAGMDRC